MAALLVVMAACNRSPVNPFKPSPAQQAAEAAKDGAVAQRLMKADLGYTLGTELPYKDHGGFTRKLCQNDGESCQFAYYAWTSADGNLLLAVEGSGLRCSVPTAFQKFVHLPVDKQKEVLRAPFVYAGSQEPDRTAIRVLGNYFLCSEVPEI